MHVEQLKMEYVYDKEEKDKRSVNLYKGLKLLGDTAKKIVIEKYYKKCKKYYERLYSRLRELQKETLISRKDSKEPSLVRDGVIKTLMLRSKSIRKVPKNKEVLEEDEDIEILQ